MINYHIPLVNALEEATGIKPYYEMVLHSGINTPCITYYEITNNEAYVGDTVGYSRIGYTVKVWGKSIAEIEELAKQIDAALKPLGFMRIGSYEMSDKNSAMIQKILDYEGLFYETY